MDFETIDAKFRNGDPLTNEEIVFLVSEYRKRIIETRKRLNGYFFNLNNS